MPKNTTAIFDLDHTLTRVDTYAAFLLAALNRWPSRYLRTIPLVFAIGVHKLGFRDNSWLKEFALRTILSGISKQDMESLSQDFADNIVDTKLRGAAAEMLQMHRDAEHQIILATASFDFYVEKIAARLNFDQHVCTASSWDESHRLTGKLGSPNCYGDEKNSKIQTLLKSAAPANLTVLYTDHHSDLPSMNAVDIPVAVNPTARLKRIAVSRNYLMQNWNDSANAVSQFDSVMDAVHRRQP